MKDRIYLNDGDIISATDKVCLFWTKEGKPDNPQVLKVHKDSAGKVYDSNKMYVMFRGKKVQKLP